MRINIIPVELLADQHLIAEYREIKMLPKCIIRSSKSKNGIDYNSLPKEYTLNAGHGKFFYNKLSFIENRFKELIQEMKNRNFNVTCTELYDKKYNYSIISEINYSVDFIPTQKEMYINLIRIVERISDKPNRYKFKGKSSHYDFFIEFYNNFIKSKTN